MNTPPAPKIIATSRALRADLAKFNSSPLLALNPRGRVALERTQVFLEEIEDLADRVTLLEIALASSTESVEVQG